jgi:hypothetical protein
MGSARKRSEREYKKLKCDCGNVLLDRRSKRSRLKRRRRQAPPALLGRIQSRVHTRQIVALLPPPGQLSRMIWWWKPLGLHHPHPGHQEAPLCVITELS